MGDGIDVLGPAAAPSSATPGPVPAQAVATMGDDERRATALHILRPQVRQLLQIIPRSLADRQGNPHLALTEQEANDGTDIWCEGLDALFPELERFTKFLAVLGMLVWTGGIAYSRIVMVKETVRLRRQEAARRARGEGGQDADSGSGGEAEDGGVSRDDDATDPRFQ